MPSRTSFSWQGHPRQGRDLTKDDPMPGEQPVKAQFYVGEQIVSPMQVVVMNMPIKYSGWYQLNCVCRRVATHAPLQIIRKSFVFKDISSSQGQHQKHLEETKRAPKKARGLHPTLNLSNRPCSVCGRLCRSNLGYISHRRKFR